MNCEECGYELDDSPVLGCYNERVYPISYHDKATCQKNKTQKIEVVIAPMPLPVARIHKMPVAWLSKAK